MKWKGSAASEKEYRRNFMCLFVSGTGSADEILGDLPFEKFRWYGNPAWYFPIRISGKSWCRIRNFTGSANSIAGFYLNYFSRISNNLL